MTKTFQVAKGPIFDVGYKNKIINGDFLVNQRGSSQTTAGYGSVDRWNCYHEGTTKTASQVAFAIGQTEVPGNPEYFMRHVVTSVAGAANRCLMIQSIENVRILAGKLITLTFWARADANKNIAIELRQDFGSGAGSPSTPVDAISSQLVALTTSWKKYSILVQMPSIADKSIGQNINSSFTNISFWFDAGSNHSSRAASLGQQSGTFDIAHVSIVEGDVRSEADPFYPRHFGQELALCQRYYYTTSIGVLAYSDTVVIGTSADVRTKYSMMWLPEVMRANPTVTVTSGWSVSSGIRFINAYKVLRQDTGDVCSLWIADAELG